MFYRLKKHTSDPTNPPILIFPEGTCINNTSVMQFKKGSFEVGGVIYPVAIKVILHIVIENFSIANQNDYIYSFPLLSFNSMIQGLEMPSGTVVDIQ